MCLPVGLLRYYFSSYGKTYKVYWILLLSIFYVHSSELIQQYESTVKITYPSVIQLVLRFVNLPCLSYLHLSL